MSLRKQFSRREPTLSAFATRVRAQRRGAVRDSSTRELQGARWRRWQFGDELRYENEVGGTVDGRGSHDCRLVRRGYDSHAAAETAQAAMTCGLRTRYVDSCILCARHHARCMRRLHLRLHCRRRHLRAKRHLRGVPEERQPCDKQTGDKFYPEFHHFSIGGPRGIAKGQHGARAPPGKSLAPTF